MKKKNVYGVGHVTSRETRGLPAKRFEMRLWRYCLLATMFQKVGLNRIEAIEMYSVGWLKSISISP